jgi:hypothetical protein
MIEQIGWIALFAMIAGLSVPPVILLLAKFGLFEPISFTLMGQEWRFAPKIRQVSFFSDASLSAWPRQTAFATVVTAAISVAPPLTTVPQPIASFCAATSLPGEVDCG